MYNLDCQTSYCPHNITCQQWRLRPVTYVARWPRPALVSRVSSLKHVAQPQPMAEWGQRSDGVIWLRMRRVVPVDVTE